MILGCDIHTHVPAPNSYTQIVLYQVVPIICSTSTLGHGHGYESHSPDIV